MSKFLFLIFAFILATLPSFGQTIEGKYGRETVQTVNFIKDGNAEAYAPTTGKGWRAYCDAAGTRPVDGNGGTTTGLSNAVSTSSPLAGKKSFTFTKDANNRQGCGWAYDFTIEDSNKAKVDEILFDYLISAGTFVAATNTTDSDVIVYIYDVTNGAMIEPSSIKLFSNGSTNSAIHKSNFQTAYNSGSYRLILHIATTSASTYTIKSDSVSIAASKYIYGTPITDWTDAGAVTVTATTTNPTKGTVTLDKYYWRRVGSNLEGRYEYRQTAGGANGSGDYLYQVIPSGLSIDTTKVTAYTTIGSSTTIPNSVGGGSTGASGEYSVSSVVVYDTTKIRVWTGALTSTSFNFLGSGWMGLGTATQSIAIYFSVPVLGWSSATQMSDSASTRVITARASGATASTTSANIIIFPTTDYDTHGAYNGTTGRYTAPVSGYYNVATFMGMANTAVSYAAYVDGVLAKYMGNGGSAGSSGGSTQVYVNAGQLIDIRPASTTGAISSAWVSFTQVQGPSAIAATDPVYARYRTSTNQTSSTTQPINYDTKDIDSHGAVTVGSSWKFTAPAAGVYFISATSASTASNFGVSMYKNGVIDSSITSSNASAPTGGAQIIRLIQGDYIDMRFSSSGTANGTNNYISIVRIGL